jgi:hypothetical protein
MNNKKTTNILLVVILILVILVVIYLLLSKKILKTTLVKNETLISTQATQQATPPETSIKYSNTQYGFNFSLPLSWKGYSILNENWEGSIIVNSQNDQKFSGPEISIRHPLWTTLNPRQDIPIMVFTLKEWDLVQQEKLSVSSAPIPPSELGRNAKYVFALPARYNFAFQTGFEEVEKIIENKPLQAF